MFRKQISPKVTAVVVVVLLGLVQFAYWRLLVYQEPGGEPGGGGGGGMPPPIPSVAGREDIEVRTFSGDAPGFQDGKVWNARYCGPNALAVDANGVLYVADSRNHRVRRITPDGEVSTLAGGGSPDGAGGRADGEATAARFRFPSGVAVAPDGAVYVADTGNHRICRVRDGQVVTVAGGTEGKADGAGATARFSSPAALSVDDAGSVWIADLGNRAVRRLDVSGQVTTPSSVPWEVSAMLGEVRPASTATPITASVEGRGEPVPTTFSQGRRSPGTPITEGIALYADTEHGVLMVSQPGAAPLLAAGRRSEAPPIKGVTDGTGSQASFALPCAAVQGKNGAIYVADYEGSVIRQVRLPEWLRKGGTAPAAPRTGRRRMRRER